MFPLDHQLDLVGHYIDHPLVQRIENERKDTKEFFVVWNVSVVLVSIDFCFYRERVDDGVLTDF